MSKNSQDPQVNVRFPEVTQQAGFGGAVQRVKTRDRQGHDGDAEGSCLSCEELSALASYSPVTWSQVPGPFVPD